MAYQRSNSDQMTNLFRQLYKGKTWDSSAALWNGNPNLTAFNDQTELGLQMAKLLELIKRYQSIKLSQGIVHGFKIHMEVLIATLRVFEAVREEDAWVCKPLRQIVRATK